jgi:hypothetical protein
MPFKSLRVPANLFRLVMWIVSFVFAGFLTGLGSSLVADLPKLESTLVREQFADADALAASRQAQREAQAALQSLEAGRAPLRAELNAAANAYRQAREAFDNWLAARQATGDPQQDPEVLQRTRELDRLKAAEASAQARLDALEPQRVVAEQRQAAGAAAEARALQAADAAYERALFRQELRVFGARLALTLPLLAVAGWLVARKRHSDYWPLHRGFVLFAVFTFFVELVPYLPSYGGYVRSVVGIVLTAAAGHYVIRAMRRYLARREAAAAASEAERRRSVSSEEALRRIGAGVCPGCERAILSPAGAAPAAPAKGAPGAVVTAPETNFCVHCGMKLFDRCGACGIRKNAFFHYCPSCGAGTQADEPPGTATAG